MPGKRFDEQRLFDGELRVADDVERIIEGRAVPFGVWAQIGSAYHERMTADTFAESVTRGEGRNAPLLLDHDNKTDKLVGKALEWRIEDDGLYGRWQIDMERPAAADAWRLAAGGFLQGLSVGFEPGPVRDGDLDMSGEVPRLTRGPAALREVSMVAVGAYEDARILKVRTRGLQPPPPDPAVELRRWREWLDGERARFAG